MLLKRHDIVEIVSDFETKDAKVNLPKSSIRICVDRHSEFQVVL